MAIDDSRNDDGFWEDAPIRATARCGGCAWVAAPPGISIPAPPVCSFNPVRPLPPPEAGEDGGGGGHPGGFLAGRMGGLWTVVGFTEDCSTHLHPRRSADPQIPARRTVRNRRPQYRWRRRAAYRGAAGLFWCWRPPEGRPLGRGLQGAPSGCRGPRQQPFEPGPVSLMPGTTLLVAAVGGGARGRRLRVGGSPRPPSRGSGPPGGGLTRGVPQGQRPVDGSRTS